MQLGDGNELGAVKNYSTGTEVAVNATDTGAKVPVVQLEGMSLSTAMGTTIEFPLAANFGSILKNGVLAPKNDADTWGVDGTQYTSNFSVTKGSTGMKLVAPAKYDDTNSPEYNQRIQFKDGQFRTKLEYATNLKNSRILRYDMTSDFTKTGKTFSIPDTAQFNSYVLVNSSGDYLGLVFTQIRK